MLADHVGNNGNDNGFLKESNGAIVWLDYPGAASTQILGVNDHREVVGEYQLTPNDVMHGFTWTSRAGFTTTDDPNGVGGTVINGLNNSGQLVGFFTDAAGNVNGLLANPS